MAFGSFESFFGPVANNIGVVVNSGAVTYTMPTANNGWAAAFMATNTRDIKSVHVNFSSVSSPGSVEARIETIDGTSGKPTGTLYDAAATKTFTPTTGWNTVTFDTLPTAGMTAGAMYALVLLKSDTGTTCTLRARVSEVFGTLPVSVWTASDISTRSNFAIVANAVPICYFTDETDVIDSYGCCPSATSGTFALYGADRVAGVKITLPVAVVVRGVSLINGGIFVTGTPAGDLRVRILDGSNNAVAGTTVTIDKEYLIANAGRFFYAPMDNVALAAGTYRIALDSPSSANSSNCITAGYGVLNSSSLGTSGFVWTESTNASGAFTWTDTNTQQASYGLLIDSITAATGSSRSPRFQIVQ